ncbi:MAG: hypothetical protein V4807_01220 [Burkholderia gladioli]
MAEVDSCRDRSVDDVCCSQIHSAITFWGIALLSGFGIALVGGFASRAAMLKIKPFDNRYKKARDSYKKNDREDR